MLSDLVFANATAIALSGFFNPIAGTYSTITGIGYGFLTTLPTAAGNIADQLQTFINTMNNTDKCVIGLEFELVFDTLTSYIKQKPTQVNIHRLISVLNTKSALYTSSKLSQVYL